MYRIFIVEDDKGIADGMKTSLEKWGFECHCVEEFQNVMTEYTKFQPHLVLMDVMLPFYNGYYWCEQIRKNSKVPIVFISSAADNMNIVMAVNMGADDFIAKPFDLSVLTAKVQAMLRRAYDFVGNSELLEHRGAILNLGDNSLTYQEQKIDLSKNEYRIFLTLMENKGNVVSREKLMNKLWETDCFVDENTLTVNVNRLRKKLDQAGLEGFITTKHGVGYLIRTE